MEWLLQTLYHDSTEADDASNLLLKGETQSAGNSSHLLLFLARLNYMYLREMLTKCYIYE